MEGGKEDIKVRRRFPKSVPIARKACRRTCRRREQSEKALIERTIISFQKTILHDIQEHKTAEDLI